MGCHYRRELDAVGLIAVIEAGSFGQESNSGAKPFLLMV